MLMCRRYVSDVPTCIIKSLNHEGRAYTCGTVLKSLLRMSSCINSFPEVKHRDKQRLKSQLRCTRSFCISFEKIHLPTCEIRQENVIIKTRCL